ncbi:MAG: tetratricopeptide repeat protein [Candidatus Solibacter usitatus]|nr:tetratricopeptide repeat protein [Candidatus Solibacter usitatus]
MPGVRWWGAALLACALRADECAALLASAQRAYQARGFDQAAAGFEQALKACPQRGAILLALGQSQLMARRMEAAVRTLLQLVQLEPANVMARKLLGDAQYLAGREGEAEESLKGALAIDPKNEASLYALGRIYYQQSRYPDAVAQFEKVIAGDPGNYRAHDNLGLCFDALHRDSEALRHFFKALDLVQKDHPEYDWAHANLADFFLKRNEHEKAFQLAAEAARRNPESARNFFLTGKALSKLNKEELAPRWLEQACNRKPRPQR